MLQTKATDIFIEFLFFQELLPRFIKMNSLRAI